METTIHDDNNSPELTTCDHCATDVEEETTNVDGSEDWCDECVENDAAYCESCHTTVSEFHPVITSDAYYPQREVWCNDCAESYSVCCESCSENVASYASREHDNGWGESYCQSCWNDRFTFCDACDDYHEDDSEDECPHSVIHPYGTTPDWVTTGNGNLFFGMEIEVESTNKGGRPQSNLTNATTARDMLQDMSNGEGVWITHDGSLYNGFEITTHPISLDVWRQSVDIMTPAFVQLHRDGVRAWGQNTENHPVGIHIHVSKTGFKNEQHQMRFIHLFRSLEDAWVKAAGRRVHYANFEGLRRIKDKVKRMSSNHSDAISVRRSTIEVRIWRTTITPERIIGNVELTHAAVEFTRQAQYGLFQDKGRLLAEFTAYVQRYEQGRRVWAGEDIRFPQAVAAE